MGTVLMRLFITIFLLLPFAVFGQRFPNVVKRGDTTTLDSNRGHQYIWGTVRLAHYATPDTNKVLGVDTSGNLVLRAKGGDVDSSIYSTVKRLKDSIDAVRSSTLPNTGGTLYGNLNLNSNHLFGIPDPMDDDEAVNFGTFKDFNSGFLWKPSARVATASELPPFTFNGVDGIVFEVGACPTIDGVTLRDGDTVLNKNSTAGNQPYNGIFYVSQLGDAGTQCIFTRAPYANTEAALTRATLSVKEGVVNSGIVFTQISTITTVNVSPVTFQVVPLSAAKAGYGMIEDGNTLSVDTSKIVTQYRLNTAIASVTPDSTIWATQYRVDTVSKNTRLWVLSKGYITSADIAGKMNYTDTVALSNRINSKQGALILTTTGSSGAATLVGNALNIPQYSGGGAVDSAIYSTVYRNDTGNKNLRASLATKVNYTDTVGTSNRIEQRVKYTDTSTFIATRSWALSSVSGIGSYTTQVFSVAGTYTLTVPTGTTAIEIEGYGAGGGAAACLGGSTTVAISGGGGAGAYFKHRTISWTTVVVTVGAGGAGGQIVGCPGACAATNGSNGGTTTVTDGFSTISCPGGIGSNTVTAVNATRNVAGATPAGHTTGASLINGYGIGGGHGLQVATLVTSTMSGRGAAWSQVGQGGEGVNTANTAGNDGVGNAAGGGGCFSNAATGATNSKNGGSGKDAWVIVYFIKTGS